MMRKLFYKYKEMILYIFFGGCTTLVNVVTYFISTRVFHIQMLISTIVAWLLAVLFAYVTNRNYVFHSENYSVKAILVEFCSFISCRLLTGAMDVGVMYVLVERLKYNDLAIKILSNLLVIVINYIASRLIIFKAHDKKANH